MVQHVILGVGPDGKPTVSMGENTNLWRDDQSIVWSIGSGSNFGWDTSQPGGAIQFDTQKATWTGSAPAPIGPAPGSSQLDQRNFNAMGPGPVNNLTVYSYSMYVIDDQGNKTKIVDVDPDISNQPQP